MEQYFILSESKFSYIKNRLDDIIETYNELDIMTENILNTYDKQNISETISETNNIETEKKYIDIFNIPEAKEIYAELSESVKILKNICKKRIQQQCEHSIVKDSIDIAQEKSQQITYCEKCEQTFTQ
jgi:hypothetical protein